jgi:AcrR family transcriptional regulator
MNEKDRQTEEKIFEAATEVFVVRGMDGARMQEIADRAGINKALLHYYYRTKDRLFNAVFEKIAGKIFTKFAPILEPDLTLEEKIRFFFNEHISFLQRNPGLPLFILNEVSRNPARIRRLIRDIDIGKLWNTLAEQHSEELRKYNITEDSVPQIMTTIASISVFPFAARGILQGIFDKMGISFDDYISERKDFAAEFVIRALKKVSGVPKS